MYIFVLFCFISLIAHNCPNRMASNGFEFVYRYIFICPIFCGCIPCTASDNSRYLFFRLDATELYGLLPFRETQSVCRILYTPLYAFHRMLFFGFLKTHGYSSGVYCLYKVMFSPFLFLAMWTNAFLPLPIPLCPIVCLTKHLTVFDVCSATFAPC